MDERGIIDDAEEPAEEEDAARFQVLERLMAEARRLYEVAPRYCIRFEPDGTLSLREKFFLPSLRPLPTAPLIWRIISQHPTLEEAERRLRHITAPPIFYDAKGQVAPAPGLFHPGHDQER